MKKKICGIYSIKNIKNGKIYIGSSRNIKNRWWQHRSLLNKNEHYNHYLQRAWNKYGESSFEFTIEEQVNDPNYLISTEQIWIDKYQSFLPQNGYNICSNASNTLGVFHSDESKKIIGLRSKERNAVKSILGMKRMGEEHGNAKINDHDAKIIKLLFKDGRLTAREIGNIFGIVKENVLLIGKNLSWKHIDINQTDKLPDEYINKLEEIISNRIIKTKINDEEVKCIKLLSEETSLLKMEIARLFGISFSYVSGILGNEKRRNINITDDDSIENYRQFLFGKGINLSEILINKTEVIEEAQ
ncbi:GIY-YIG nuclease family protein [Bacillus sp. BRMEA1]|uniref:GIY-YIG nuclease family protein n=1 Tax=Neobacillus endophyticus TaxID=2738405 RepID=UPI001566E85B|nr:GIY-YIG nuclease family protein [Neobacillus endophyticus]NRD80266.1 GIY-YIG nuclease family protein [Neobacillus endophyticus]